MSFVGSTPIARYIYERARAAGAFVARWRRQNHLDRMPDADLDLTADALMGAAWAYAGERCMAISVAVAVGDEVADALIERLVPRIKMLKVGPGNDRSSEMARWSAGRTVKR